MAMGRDWTTEEDDFLKAVFPTNSTKAIAWIMDRTYSSVSIRANSRGIKKSPEYLASEASGRANVTSEKAKASRFQKGIVPHNKGKKGVRYAGSEKGWFKKGNLPHNTRFDGATRINKDGHIEMRIELAVWKTKQRIIWESVNGPVPRGHVLRFRSKALPDIYVIENIELIRMSDNMRLNSIYRYPPELVSAIKLLSKFKRRINEKQDRRPS